MSRRKGKCDFQRQSARLVAGSAASLRRKMAVCGSAIFLLLFLFSLLPFRHVWAAYGTSVPFTLSALDSEGQEALFYFNDYPGSRLQAAVSKIFPGVSAVWRADPMVLANVSEDFFQIMPEHEAYPILEHKDFRVERAFHPLYRATVVIATDTKRSSKALRSWSQLAENILEEEELGLLIRPEYMLAAMDQDGTKKNPVDFWLSQIRRVADKGNLKLFAGSDANFAWPTAFADHASQLEPEQLPACLILWDYQAAQINLLLGENQYICHVPEEGSIFVDFGIFASGERACDQLSRYLAQDHAGPVEKRLLEDGYRLSDGRSPANAESIYESEKTRVTALTNPLGYAPEFEYRQFQERVKDYTNFNKRLMHHAADFRRSVLRQNLFSPASGEEEQFFLILSIPFFLVWIASIFYRLDEDAIRLPMGLFQLSLGIWIVLHFIHVMYRGGMEVSLLDFFRFLPIFLMAASFLATAVTLAKGQNELADSARRFCRLVIFAGPVLAVVFAACAGHPLLLRVNSLGEISELGPVFYLSVAVLSLQTALALVLLHRSQPRRSWFQIYLPLIPLFLAYAYSAKFFFHGGRIRSGNFDLFSSALAVFFLETCLSTRLIPVNTNYFKLFRYCPARLRILSEDMTSIYPLERANLSAAALTAIQEKLRSAFPKEESKARFSFLFGRKSRLQDWRVRIVDPEEPDRYYGASRLIDGYLIWEENLADLNRLKNQLSDLSRQLEQQSHFLENKKNIRSQVLSMRIRREMLQNIEKSLADKMQEIRASLGNIAEKNRESDQDYVKRELGRVKIMVSQCKRKSNLLLRGEDEISMEEVKLIFREAVSDAQTAGVAAVAHCQGEGKLAIGQVLLVYDYVQHILQKSVDYKGTQDFILISKGAEQLQFQLLAATDDELRAEIFLPESELRERFEAAQAKIQSSSEEKDLRIRISLPLARLAAEKDRKRELAKDEHD